MVLKLPISTSVSQVFIFSYLSLSKPWGKHFWNFCSSSFTVISDCCCFWSSRRVLKVWWLKRRRPLHKHGWCFNNNFISTAAPRGQASLFWPTLAVVHGIWSFYILRVRWSHDQPCLSLIVEIWAVFWCFWSREVIFSEDWNKDRAFQSLFSIKPLVITLFWTLCSPSAVCESTLYQVHQ